MNDHDLEQLLRGSLQREAAKVTPSDRFDEILAEATAVPPRRSGWVAGIAAAAVVAVGLGAAWVLTFPDRTEPTPLAPVTTAATSPAPTPSATSAVCSDTEEFRALAAYYVTEGDMLDRVVLDRPACGSRAETAVLASIMPSGVPGLETLWNPVDRVSVTTDGKVLTIDLPGAAFRDDLTPQQADKALTQLVYAAMGASGPVTEVTFRRDGTTQLGEPFTSVGGTMGRTRDQTVQVGTWFDLPNGVHVPAGQPTTITGIAVMRPVSFEVVDAAGKVVLQGQATNTTALEGYGAWSFTVTVTLDPGTYTVRAWGARETTRRGLEVVVG